MENEFVKKEELDMVTKDFNLQLARLLGQLSALELVLRRVDDNFVGLNTEFGQIVFSFERQERQITQLNFDCASNTIKIKKLESSKL